MTVRSQLTGWSRRGGDGTVVGFDTNFLGGFDGLYAIVNGNADDTENGHGPSSGRNDSQHKTLRIAAHD